MSVMATASSRGHAAWPARLALAAALVAALVVAAAEGADYSDLRGPYCARSARGRDCCNHRRDDCSVPILGTLCYCDEFCNRTRSEDCCPDYWEHCLGMEPPAPLILGCRYEGRDLMVGQSIKINCNLCKCTPPMGGAGPEVLCETTACLVEPEVIREVNARHDTGTLAWRASNYTAFWGRRLDEGLALRLGTLEPQRAVKRMRPVRRWDTHEVKHAFDARHRWQGRLQPVRDQGWCGSSWALSTAAVASDRFAIMSMGEEHPGLAPMHLLACNTRGQRGCGGGYLDRAWTFLRKYGLVDDECYPYTAEQGHAGVCRLPLHTTLQAAGCRAPQQRVGAPPRSALFHTGPPYRLGSEVDIMAEIMASGPVQATMKVYHDFFMYKTGVYQKTLGAGERTGYHSVRIVGWGEEPTRNGRLKYWLVANSWGEHWGERGYFRIRRGNNECEIEEFVLASWADTVMPPVEKMKQNGNSHSNII